MRLLIITQKADRKDPVLGFFHRWIEEFSSACDSVIVLAQQVGDHSAPPNVRILSLGKELGVPVSRQIVSAWRLLWAFRRDYDAVLVHMTPVWIVLATPLLIVLRKPAYLWYEVRRGGWMLRTALFFVRRVFTATPSGLPFRSRRAMVVGHGIDTDAFSPGTAPRQDGLVAAAGRVTPIKRYDLMIRALTLLPPSHKLEIAGGTVTEGDAKEFDRLRALIDNLGLHDRVSIRSRPHAEVVDLFRRASLSLHACGGGLDKVVLEAMACGCPVVSTSEAARHVLPPSCQATDKTLGEQALRIVALSPEERARLGQELREIVMRDHSLQPLIARLVAEMQR